MAPALLPGVERERSQGPFSCPQFAQDSGPKGSARAQSSPRAAWRRHLPVPATAARAHRPGAAEGRPPGPGPARPRPRSPGPPLGPLHLLPLRMRRRGRPGLGPRLPHSSNAVLVARGTAGGRTRTGCSAGGPGGHGRQAPRALGLSGMDRLCRGQPLP